MNFLAHLYLSENNTNILIGNFIADHIPGNNFTHLHPEIQKGILFHREIDTFTDAHKIVRKSKRRLHPRYRHYKGVIIDIFYDHYLAKNWSNYSDIPLATFVQSFYDLLQDNFEILPKKTQHVLPFMVAHNWLYNYQYLEGIEKVLNGMNNRTKQKSQMHLAIEDLQNLHKEFEEDFTLFFEDLCIFSKQKLKELNQTSNTS
ncbi:Acyl carrier protein phosphodiesterase [Polaribacter huanghezhanensis]|uniref:acyl carrier protein phosphodiesterase n=1 Tax=Polaribacter huanghezhanensis TaxID=1354726 RepID=UPI00264A4038|nr:acyl carrier protein phosphodiesterase [Polaribacter huanghezhanensis]WKD86307.1 Acyl carrier protein phosphodiesterase [Polaribacter huanghezhanensis]